jgi:flagellum-specific peptidoglycan hydrolase FlgJ
LAFCRRSGEAADIAPHCDARRIPTASLGANGKRARRLGAAMSLFDECAGGPTVDESGSAAIESESGSAPATSRNSAKHKIKHEIRIDHGDRTMTSPTSKLRARLKLCAALGTAAIIVVNAPRMVDAQGLVQGVQQGAREGNKAAGPVGGVLGGAIGGVVGVVTGVTGVFTGNNGQQQPQQQPAQATASDKPGSDKQGNPAKTTKTTPKAAKMAKQQSQPPQQMQQQPVVLTQQGAPQLTAEQIVSNSDAYIERIKAQLNLTPEQEKNWGSFSSAMHYLGHNGAERLNLRVARAKRDPPDDIIEQMRNEAQFLVDRAADQRNVADAAEPLFASLDDKQKQTFIDEMVRLSHERGLD